MDLRAKVLAAYDRGGTSQRQLADRFGLALSTVQNWLKRRRETGAAAPRQAPGATPKLDAEGRAALAEIIDSAPDGTLAEWADTLAERAGCRLDPSTVWRYARAMGRTGKKRRLAPRSATATT